MSMSFGKNIAKSFSIPAGAKLPPLEGTPFGTIFAPVMFDVHWSQAHGWDTPKLINYGPISVPPQCAALNYAVQCFEGMKAYTGPKGELRLFRPELNAERLQRSMSRLVLPTVSTEDFVHAVGELVAANRDFVPREFGYSLYLRPTAIGNNEALGVQPSDKAQLYMIASPVGPYFPSGVKPVKLLVSNTFRRAFHGGTGSFKLGANYAGPLAAQMMAKAVACDQVLWLGPDDTVDEVGAMNFMVLWRNKEGQRELITAPLDQGTILPGITRNSILQLARAWGDMHVAESRYTITDLCEAVEEGRVEEAFGCGTAAVVIPVSAVHHNGKDYPLPVPMLEGDSFTQRVQDTLVNIQFGRLEHEWSHVVA